MKIAITGHTKGIGKAMFETLSKEHECIGFSRSTGHDIGLQQNVIINSVSDCDVFINNAYKGMEQMNILNKLWEHWKFDETKTIVNIISQSKYPGISGNTSGYSAYKAALAHQAFILMFKDYSRKCRMINVNPGYTDTGFGSHVTGVNKLTTGEVADAIAWAVNQPQHIEIGELGLWRTSL